MNDIIKDENGIWTDKRKMSVSYPDKGNQSVVDIEEKSFWFSHRNQILKQVIERYPFEKNYADIGGGNGFQVKYISENFKSTVVFLIEPGYSGCINARKKGIQNVYNIPFEKFDFVTNEVSAVGLYDVIEHIEEDDLFLKRLKNKLPRGSLVYITVPAHNYLWSGLDDFGGHYRRYNLNMIRQLSVKANIELIFASYFFSYIPPFTFLLRSLPYRLRGKAEEKKLLADDEEKHNPSSAVLSVFNFFHKYELKKIQHSAVPFGGSCIAVFRT